MNVIIAGESPFIEAVGALCRAAGHQTALYLVEDFIGALQSPLGIDDLLVADVVIEMHHESADTKQELLFALSSALPPDALILTSALTVSATQAAAWCAVPQRVVGFGVLPPLVVGDSVEIAAALQSDSAATARAAAFWRTLGLTPVTVGDGTGLVRARILCCVINEAIGALQEGIATAEAIDRAMQLGTNYPRGPLAWGDLLGLDTVLGVLDGLQAEWGEDRYRPAPLLRRMVLAGRLGRKTGRGFYTYDA